MAAVYDYELGFSITEGLQGCNVCNEALSVARSIAARRGEAVVLDDDDGMWLVEPDGECTRAPEEWIGNCCNDE